MKHTYARITIIIAGMLVSHLVLGQLSEREKSCKNCLEQHYGEARDSIIRVWTVLDTMRSISIAPKDRIPFVHKMFADVVDVMHLISGLAASCQFCADYYYHHKEDIIYLEEILGYMMEAFEAVFKPLVNSEEKLLYMVMESIVASMDVIRQELSQVAFKTAP